MFMRRSVQSKKRLRKVLNLALPSSINSFLDTFVISLCLFFIGSLGYNHILAVSVSLTFFTMTYAFVSLFYVGANTQISHLFGAKKFNEIPKVVFSIATGAFMSSIFITILGLIIAPYYFAWLHIDKKADELANIFTLFLMLSFPATIIKSTMIASFAAIGNTIYPLIIRIFSATLSCLLYYLLIFGEPALGIPALGIKGAGIAILISSYIELVLFVIFFYKEKILSSNLSFAVGYLKKGAKIGLPTSLERSIMLFSIVLTSKLFSHYGDIALAGSQIGGRVESFSFMPAFGFMVASMVLVGQSLGARKFKLAKIYVGTILVVTTIVMLIAGMLLIIFGKHLSLIFTSNEEVILYSYLYLIAVGASQVPQIWIFVLDGAMRGAMFTKTTLAINTLSLWVLRIIPMAILVHVNAPIWTLFATICTETFLRAGIFWSFLRFGGWEKIRATTLESRLESKL